MNKGILELHDALANGEVTSEELVKEALDNSRMVQEKCNAFVTIVDDAKGGKVSNDVLSGIPFGVKDNLATKDILTTGSSNTLNNYVPVFNATAVQKLLDKGAIIANKTVLDEFGMGGSGTTGATGAVKNPWNKTRICGGSSAGSACAVAAGVYPYALGSDTGDSIRKPAAFCGIVGYKPTYGMVSRYGLFPYASSMDTVGVLTRSVEDASIVVDAISGKDINDMTTWDSSNINLRESLTGKVSNKKLFYLKEVCDINRYSNPSQELREVLEKFNKILELCKELEIEVTPISFDLDILELLSPTYRVIANAEATSNLSNLTGISFGPKAQGESIKSAMINFRTKGFSPLIKRRLVIGSYVLQSENQERYFKNACRARRLIVDNMLELFKDYDGMIMPGLSGVAKVLDGEFDKVSKNPELLDEYLLIANLGGFPSITIPSGFIDGLSIGINITGNRYKDEDVLNIAYALESKMEYKGQVAKVGEER